MPKKTTSEIFQKSQYLYSVSFKKYKIFFNFSNGFLQLCVILERWKTSLQTFKQLQVCSVKLRNTYCMDGKFSIHCPNCSFTNFLNTNRLKILNKTNLHIETITQVVASIKTNATAKPAITPIKSGDCKISWIQSFRSPHHFTEVFVSSKGLMLPEMSEFDVSGTESTTSNEFITCFSRILNSRIYENYSLFFNFQRVVKYCIGFFDPNK